MNNQNLNGHHASLKEDGILAFKAMQEIFCIKKDCKVYVFWEEIFAENIGGRIRFFVPILPMSDDINLSKQEGFRIAMDLVYFNLNANQQDKAIDSAKNNGLPKLTKDYFVVEQLGEEILEFIAGEIRKGYSDEELISLIQKDDFIFEIEKILPWIIRKATKKFGMIKYSPIEASMQVLAFLRKKHLEKATV